MSEIRIEAKPVVGGATGSGHLYLVYRDDQNNEFVTRAGPSRNFIGNTLPSVTDITVEVNVPIEQSRDTRPNTMESLSIHGSRVLDLKGRSAEDVWAEINAEAARIGRAQVDYDILGPNSNTFVIHVLDFADIDAVNQLPNAKGIGGSLFFSAYPGIEDVNDLRAEASGVECFLAGTPITMADGSQKPIEAVRPDDWVMSFDRDGNKVPGRVKRTFRNEAKIVLDFHGTFVTPGHVYYCAGGRFEGQFVPLMDILRDDGIVQHEDGRLIRAATGCTAGSDDDRLFWAFLVGEDADGTERVRDKCQLRLGSRFMLKDGRHFSMREYMDGIGIELIEGGPYDGYVRFRKSGIVTIFGWTLSDRLPKPEDFVLQRSGTSLADIYRAAEWESTHPRLPAPTARESGPVQPLAAAEHNTMPRNTPLAFSTGAASSALQPNRKARKAEAARQRKEMSRRGRLH